MAARSPGWKGPRGQWTCKSPGFIGGLAAIIETYPDARLVWTHRDPATTIVSLSSTSHFAQHRYSADDFGVDAASVLEELEVLRRVRRALLTVSFAAIRWRPRASLQRACPAAPNRLGVG